MECCHFYSQFLLRQVTRKRKRIFKLLQILTLFYKQIFNFVPRGNRFIKKIMLEFFKLGFLNFFSLYNQNLIGINQLNDNLKILYCHQNMQFYRISRTLAQQTVSKKSFTRFYLYTLLQIEEVKKSV